MVKINSIKYLGLSGILVLFMIACKDKSDQKKVDTSGIATAIPAPNIESSRDPHARRKKTQNKKITIWKNS